MLNRFIAYIKYLLKSFHLHGIHSPFVFEFQQDILNSKFQFYCFEEIESIRAKLLLTDLKIEVLDLGAGSKTGNRKSRKINQIAKSALKKPKYAQLLFRLVHQYQPMNIIELGSSLGISTCYLAMANPKAKVITCEGAPEIAKIARINFEKLDIENIELLEGNFNQILPQALGKLNQVDLVFFDGNHQKSPTLEYFKLCLEKAHENSIFIFDDINWSSAMQAAWKEVKGHPKVKISIDLFEMGIIFFRDKQEKQDFTIYH